MEDLFIFPCDTCGFNAEGPRSLREHIANAHAKEELKKQLETSEASKSPTSINTTSKPNVRNRQAKE